MYHGVGNLDLMPSMVDSGRQKSNKNSYGFHQTESQQEQELPEESPEFVAKITGYLDAYRQGITDTEESYTD